MRDYSDNAENLKYELKSLKAKYLEIEEGQKCEECYDSIFDQEFYVFPCLHCFHRVHNGRKPLLTLDIVLPD